MGKEKTKVKAHKILKKPVLAAILLMIWGFVMPMAFSVHLSNKNVQYFVIVVTGLLLYGVHKLWFRPEFKGCFCKNFGNREINKFYIIVAIVDVLLMIIGLAITGIASPTLTTLLMAIEAGVVEELAFRALPQSVMMRDWMDEKHIMFTAVFTSIIFGGIHAANAVAGADGMSTVFQVFSAFAMGMFFSAVYLRTGNILYTVIFHAVHDYISFMTPGVETGLVTVELSIFDIISIIISSAVFLVIAFYLLRKSVRADIVEVWKNRWSVL